MINLLCFNQQQQIVFWGVISAFIFSLTFVLIGYFVIALPLGLFNTAESRLIFSLRCQIFPVQMLFAGIVAVGNGRFSSAAINPLANAESEAMRIHLRYLSNTKKAICAVFCRQFNPFYLFRYLQHQADSNFGKFVFLGRRVFWIGYLKEPIQRAFGLEVTLYPTIAVLIYDAYRVLFFNS